MFKIVVSRICLTNVKLLPPPLVKAVDPQNKKEEEEEDGEMGIFYNPSKIFKLVQLILINVGTSKKMLQKVLIEV